MKEEGELSDSSQSGNEKIVSKPIIKNKKPKNSWSNTSFYNNKERDLLSKKAINRCNEKGNKKNDKVEVSDEEELLRLKYSALKSNYRKTKAQNINIAEEKTIECNYDVVKMDIDTEYETIAKLFDNTLLPIHNQVNEKEEQNYDYKFDNRPQNVPICNNLLLPGLLPAPKYFNINFRQHHRSSQMCKDQDHRPPVSSLSLNQDFRQGHNWQHLQQNLRNPMPFKNNIQACFANEKNLNIDNSLRFQPQNNFLPFYQPTETLDKNPHLPLTSQNLFDYNQQFNLTMHKTSMSQNPTNDLSKQSSQNSMPLLLHNQPSNYNSFAMPNIDQKFLHSISLPQSAPKKPLLPDHPALLQIDSKLTISKEFSKNHSSEIQGFEDAKGKQDDCIVISEDDNSFVNDDDFIVLDEFDENVASKRQLNNNSSPLIMNDEVCFNSVENEFERQKSENSEENSEKGGVVDVGSEEDNDEDLLLLRKKLLMNLIRRKNKDGSREGEQLTALSTQQLVSSSNGSSCLKIVPPSIHKEASECKSTTSSTRSTLNLTSLQSFNSLSNQALNKLVSITSNTAPRLSFRKASPKLMGDKSGKRKVQYEIPCHNKLRKINNSQNQKDSHGKSFMDKKLSIQKPVIIHFNRNDDSDSSWEGGLDNGSKNQSVGADEKLDMRLDSFLKQTRSEVFKNSNDQETLKNKKQDLSTQMTDHQKVDASNMVSHASQASTLSQMMNSMSSMKTSVFKNISSNTNRQVSMSSKGQTVVSAPKSLVSYQKSLSLIKKTINNDFCSIKGAKTIMNVEGSLPNNIQHNSSTQDTLSFLLDKKIIEIIGIKFDTSNKNNDTMNTNKDSQKNVAKNVKSVNVNLNKQIVHAKTANQKVIATKTNDNEENLKSDTCQSENAVTSKPQATANIGSSVMSKSEAQLSNHSELLMIEQRLASSQRNLELKLFTHKLRKLVIKKNQESSNLDKATNQWSESSILLTKRRGFLKQTEVRVAKLKEQLLVAEKIVRFGRRQVEAVELKNKNLKDDVQKRTEELEKIDKQIVECRHTLQSLHRDPFKKHSLFVDKDVKSSDRVSITAKADKLDSQADTSRKASTGDKKSICTPNVTTTPTIVQTQTSLSVKNDGTKCVVGGASSVSSITTPTSINSKWGSILSKYKKINSIKKQQYKKSFSRVKNALISAKNGNDADDNNEEKSNQNADKVVFESLEDNERKTEKFTRAFKSMMKMPQKHATSLFPSIILYHSIGLKLNLQLSFPQKLLKDHKTFEKTPDVQRMTKPFSEVSFSGRLLKGMRVFNDETDFKDPLCNNNINPNLPLCPYELLGRCNDDKCPWQHEKAYLKDHEEVLMDIIHLNPTIVPNYNDSLLPIPKLHLIKEYVKNFIEKNKHLSTDQRLLKLFYFAIETCPDALTRMRAGGQEGRHVPLNLHLLLNKNNFFEEDEEHADDCGDLDLDSLSDGRYWADRSLRLKKLENQNLNKSINDAFDEKTIRSEDDDKESLQEAMRRIYNKLESQKSNRRRYAEAVDDGLKEVARWVEKRSSDAVVWKCYLSLFNKKSKLFPKNKHCLFNCRNCEGWSVVKRNESRAEECREFQTQKQFIYRKAFTRMPSSGLLWQLVESLDDYSSKMKACKDYIDMTFNGLCCKCTQSQEDKEACSHHMVEVLLFQVHLAAETAHYGVVLHLFKSYLESEKCTKLKEHLMCEDFVLLWLCYIHFFIHMSIPSFLYQSTTQRPFILLTKEPFVLVNFHRKTNIPDTTDTLQLLNQAITDCLSLYGHGGVMEESRSLEWIESLYLSKLHLVLKTHSKDLPRHTKDTLDNFPFFSHVQLFAIQNASYFSATPVVSTTEGAEKVESVCLNKDAKQAFEGGDGGNQKIEVDEATVNKCLSRGNSMQMLTTQMITEALERNPHSAKLVHLISRHLASKGKHQMALGCLEGLVERIYGKHSCSSEYLYSRSLKIPSSTLGFLSQSRQRHSLQLNADKSFKNDVHFWLCFCLLLELKHLRAPLVYKLALQSLHPRHHTLIWLHSICNLSQSSGAEDLSLDLFSLVNQSISELPVSCSTQANIPCYHRCNVLIDFVCDSFKSNNELVLFLKWIYQRMPQNSMLAVKLMQGLMALGDLGDLTNIMHLTLIKNKQSYFLWKICLNLNDDIETYMRNHQPCRLLQLQHFYDDDDASKVRLIFHKALSHLPFSSKLWKNYMLFEASLDQPGALQEATRLCRQAGVRVSASFLN